MSFDFTRQSLLQTILYFLLLLAILWNRELFFVFQSFPEVVVESLDQSGYMPLSMRCMAYVSSVPGLLLGLAVLLLFFNAFFLTRIVIRNVLFINRSYLPSLLFLLYCSLMTEMQLSVISQCVVLFFLLGFENLFMIPKADHTVKYTLNGSFFIGLSSLFYLPSVAFSLLVFVILFLYDRFSFREWLVAVIGFLAAPFFYSYFLWIVGEPFPAYYYQAVSVFKEIYQTGFFEWQSIPWPGYLLGGITFGYLLWSVTVFFKRAASLNIWTVKSYLFFLWMLLFSLILVVVFYATRITLFPIAAVPVTVLLTVLVRLINKQIVVNSLLGLLLIGILLFNMMN